jgi:hypothetical protein
MDGHNFCSQKKLAPNFIFQKNLWWELEATHACFICLSLLGLIVLAHSYSNVMYLNYTGI